MIYKNVDIGTKDLKGFQYVVDEMPGYFRILKPFIEGATVVDVGGHCGSFAVKAIEAGAQKVISFEPTPSVFKMLSRNAKRVGSITAINSAVISKRDTEVEFHFHPVYPAQNTLDKVPRLSPKTLTVPAVQLSKQLSTYKPSVVKIDCEGGEYDLLINTEFPNYVKVVIVELHLTTKSQRERYPEAVAKFDGWEVLKAPKDNWHVCLAAWKRN